MYQMPELISKFSKFLTDHKIKRVPSTLYDPVNYIMNLGGKRIRPALVLASYNLYREDVNEAMEAAYAIEMFHNFSLVHDDIMDEASLRRGKPTVHIKYDNNSAILSGDVMMILAYQYFEKYDESVFKSCVQCFTDTNLLVCEGQRMDMDFETMTNVTIDQYIKMIELKTSVLIGAAMKIGALIGSASVADADHLYQFGKNIGIAFQIQDDILDVFGQSEKVGKVKAGDIIQNKKTYLYLKSLELLGESDKQKLLKLYSTSEVSDTEKVELVTKLFKSAHVMPYAEELKSAYMNLAYSHIDAVKVDEANKSVLKEFAKYLIERNS